MDNFLKKYTDAQSREGRVVKFFSNVDLSKKLLETNNLIDLEIGCGHGHWLNSYSDSNQNITCIGIDLNTKRIDKSNNKKNLSNRNNLFFFKAEAFEFITFMPKKIKIRNIFILFPDPWPKKKHHKRRLIQNSFLDHLKLYSTKNSLLFFRTDFYEYFEWTKDKINQSRSWNLNNENLPFEHETYFQNLLPNFNTLSAAPILA